MGPIFGTHNALMSFFKVGRNGVIEIQRSSLSKSSAILAKGAAEARNQSKSTTVRRRPEKTGSNRGMNRVGVHAASRSDNPMQSTLINNSSAIFVQFLPTVVG
jgi:hypothetical protein